MAEPKEEPVFLSADFVIETLPTRWRKAPEPPPPNAGAEMRQAGIDAGLYDRDDSEFVNVERGSGQDPSPP